MRAWHGHPRADLELVRPRAGAVDCGDGVDLTLDEPLQQFLIGGSRARLDHVRDEARVGVLDSSPTLDRGAGQGEPASAHRRAAAQSLALFDEGHAESARGDSVGRGQTGEPATDDDHVGLSSWRRCHDRRRSSRVALTLALATASARNRATSTV